MKKTMVFQSSSGQRVSIDLKPGTANISLATLLIEEHPRFAWCLVQMWLKKFGYRLTRLIQTVRFTVEDKEK